MSKLPEAPPIPEKSAVRLTGSSLVVASPQKVREACFSVPAMRALRHAQPHLDLTILSPQSIAPLWETVEQVNRVVSYPDRASVNQIGKALARCEVEFDSSLAWEASNAAIAFAKARVPQRLGYELKRLGKRLTDKLKVERPSGPPVHRVRFYMGFIEKLGMEAYHARNFEPPALPPRPNPLRIALIPGSDFGSAYQWEVARFGELANALLAHFPVELVILANPQETEPADELESLLNGAIKNYAHEFDVPDLLNALRHCSFVIANDSTVVHLAAHFGVPVVALFGPGDPVVTRPLGRQHSVLSQYVECSPCLQESCPLDDHFCMEELTIGRVFEAVSALLHPPAQSTANS